MGVYPALYRLGIRPWERYGSGAGPQIEAAFDRERAEWPTPPGRALDIGCGRGMQTPKLAERGWEAVGIDLVPSAVEHARGHDRSGARFEVADVTRLPASLGRFEHFVDIGCFQTLGSAQRSAAARSITALASPGATLLMLAFGQVWFSYEGVSRGQVEEAFADWQLVSAEPAPTTGLGWPLDRTEPMWFRMRLRA
ncbi:class I SAM-dependent methyltransferase [Agrococcus beijingensis]|uniref:class I SAM-dependent methyltransferase n=1 Tax=Agrococcus beijingensis TaxID=3068634 RepID=UPI0027426631|nr:class I SAM-dependent methyltransferase [Agrococcus sp. REN33]